MTDYDLYQRCAAMLKREYNDMAARYAELAIPRLQAGEHPWLAEQVALDLMRYTHRRWARAMSITVPAPKITGSTPSSLENCDDS